ncbi:MAG: hypothetical protein M1482_07665 [Chloroflexi bacterium]|nr:hypothetical protein [Chloroflexota bacterium]
MASRLSALLSKEQNQSGAISVVINNRRRELSNMKERLKDIDAELASLLSDRDRIDARVQQLQTERESIVGAPTPEVANGGHITEPPAGLPKHAAIPHILRLLTERQANSKSRAVKRAWLDEQLVGKVDRVDNKEAVSFGLWTLKDAGKIDYGKRAGKIDSVWLT